jgi:hypothetical protein
VSRVDDILSEYLACTMMATEIGIGLLCRCWALDFEKLELEIIAFEIKYK